jgi:hypothetical protein
MYVYAVFLNRNDTLQFINVLKRNRIVVSLASTPKGLGSSCTVAAKFYFKNIDFAKRIVKGGLFKSFSNFYQLKTKNGHAIFEVL